MRCRHWENISILMFRLRFSVRMKNFLVMHKLHFFSVLVEYHISSESSFSLQSTRNDFLYDVSAIFLISWCLNFKVFLIYMPYFFIHSVCTCSTFFDCPLNFNLKCNVGPKKYSKLQSKLLIQGNIFCTILFCFLNQ